MSLIPMVTVSVRLHQCFPNVGFPPSGRLREQRRVREEAPLHQGGRGGLRVRGGALPPRQDPLPRRPGPGAALPPAAAEALQAVGRPRSARQPADPRGELQLPAAGAQPSVGSHSLIHQADLLPVCVV